LLGIFKFDFYEKVLILSTPLQTKIALYSFENPFDHMCQDVSSFNKKLDNFCRICTGKDSDGATAPLLQCVRFIDLVIFSRKFKIKWMKINASMKS